MTSTAHIETEIREALATIRRAWKATENPPKPPPVIAHMAPGSKPPGNLDAISARRACRDDLIKLANQLIAWRKLKHTKIPKGDITHLCTWIDKHTSYLVSDDGPGQNEAHRIESTLNRHARRLTRIGADIRARRFYVWSCVATIEKDYGNGPEQEPCPGDLYALIRSTDDVLPAELVCDHEDSHRWAAHEWVTLGKQLWKDAGNAA